MDHQIVVKGTLFISKYTVMKSAAGYYIGRYCYEYMGDIQDDPTDRNNWCLQPYDRDTSYIKLKQKADEYLEDFKRGGEDTESTKEFEIRFNKRLNTYARLLNEKE